MRKLVIFVIPALILGMVAVVAAQANPTAMPGGSPAASPVASPSITTVGLGHAAGLPAFLTNNRGMTLYVFDKDTPGKSACTGACATIWPPLYAVKPFVLPPGVAGTLGTITRPDGTMQLTYNGKPLYLYSKDTKPGDTKGNGIAGLWHVAAAALSGTPTAGSPVPATPKM